MAQKGLRQVVFTNLVGLGLFRNRKIAKAAKTSRLAGVPVRSGVKAGKMHDFGSGHGFNPPGADPGGLFG